MRRPAQIAAMIILFSVISWMIYVLAVSPDQMYIRLNDEATLGSKWRIVFMPVIMALTYFVLRQAEKMGMINTPDKDPVSPQEASQIAANINLVVMVVFVAVIMGMVSGESWPVGKVATTLLYVAFLVTALVIMGVFIIKFVTSKHPDRTS